jgi:hypothetical protein
VGAHHEARPKHPVESLAHLVDHVAESFRSEKKKKARKKIVSKSGHHKASEAK